MVKSLGSQCPFVDEHCRAWCRYSAFNLRALVTKYFLVFVLLDVSIDSWVESEQ